MKYPDDFINKVICGDCLEIMKHIPDGAVDLVLTDPPYGIGIAKNGKVGGRKACPVTDYGNQQWDYSIPSKETFDSIVSVSSNQVIFGGNYFIEYLSNSPCWIVWDKDNTGNFADCELAWTSFKTATRKFKWRWNGMLQENMSKKEYRVHPTQKPLPLMRWIVEKYSQPNDLILDPFLGSGTTAVACKQLGRRYIGIEINESYCEIAEQRLAQEELF